MYRSTSSIASSLIEQRARWSPFQIYLVLMLLGMTAALSCFFMAPHAHTLNTEHVRLPGVHIRDAGEDIAIRTAHSKQASAAAATAKLAAAAAGAAERPVGPCHQELHADYAGEDVIEWGDKHVKVYLQLQDGADTVHTTVTSTTSSTGLSLHPYEQASAEECCAACRAAQQRGCNVWVFCAAPQGCSGHKEGECWLKRQRQLNLLQPAGYRDESLGWTSGALFDDAKREQLVSAEVQRLAKLRDDPELPLVYFDVSIKGVPQGRITMVLFTKEAPRAAENFRQLCTGEHGFAAADDHGKRKAYHFKGAPFYRIIDQFIDQAGVDTDSVFGGQFKDDPGGLRLLHDRKGLLSMANTGPNTNTAHFSIMLGPAPHLNGNYTIFGEVVSGFEVVKAVNALSKGKTDRTATAADGAVITESGQLRRGIYKPVLQQF